MIGGPEVQKSWTKSQETSSFRDTGDGQSYILVIV